MTTQIENLSFNYGRTAVLKEIDIEIEDGEVLSLVEPNGAGKSTLLKCINRILKLTGKAVRADGEDIQRLGLRKLARIFGYVPQTTHNTLSAAAALHATH